MSVRVLLIQPSCLEGVINVRDGEAEDGDIITRFGFFDESTGYVFNSSGSVAIFNLETRNKSCRVNLDLEVVAKGTFDLDRFRS